MSELMGIDMPEFQLPADRREYLREHGTLIEEVGPDGKKRYSTPLLPSTIVDDDGTTIYLGVDEVVRRENAMRVIEQTPAWILRAIMQDAKANYAARDVSVWPQTAWSAQYGIRHVFEMLRVDDDVMPVNLRKQLYNNCGPLIGRFLIRAHPEYAETHFIGIKRRVVKDTEQTDDPDQMELDIVDRKKEQVTYCLDDYLFPELKGLTANAVTAPATALNPEER